MEMYNSSMLKLLYLTGVSEIKRNLTTLYPVHSILKMNYFVYLLALFWMPVSLACDCQVRLLNQEYTNAALVIHGFVLSEKTYELEQSRSYLDSLGKKALVGEFIGGELARAIGLKVPELVFMNLDDSFSKTEPDEEIQDLLAFSVGLNLGLHFLSSAITYDPLVSKVRVKSLQK